MYRTLNPDKTVRTINALSSRITARFPDSSLSLVCEELARIAHENRSRSEWIAKPNLWLRGGVTLLIVLSLVALAYSVSLLDLSLRSFDLGELVQITEAGLNDLVLIGAAVFFLVTVEARIKRTRALQALHELRTIAHVIDMHQLTKDPSAVLETFIVTPASPKRTLNALELTRYLDYCSEMLSLTGKVAALYAQNFPDSVVLSSVNELESLTTGLSRKIWQKIMILQKLSQDHEASSQGRTGYTL